MSRIPRPTNLNGAATFAWWLAIAAAPGCGGRLENGNEVLAAGAGFGGVPTQAGSPAVESSSPATGIGMGEPATILGAGGALSATYGPSGGAESPGLTTVIQGAGGAVVTAAGGASNINYACSETTNLVTAASHGYSGSWIGGDPSELSDNPCGVQGEIYAFGDRGYDNIRYTSDDSLQSPTIDQTSSNSEPRLASPCWPDACCIKGRTSFWPVLPSGRQDTTASVWGAGIGISLSDLAMGRGKAAYSGPAKGFTVETTGTLSGHAIRYSYTQSPNDASPPFGEVLGFGVAAVLFTTVECPDSSSTCLAPTPHPYDLLIQVVGGDVAGDFELCLKSVTPIL